MSEDYGSRDASSFLVGSDKFIMVSCRDQILGHIRRRTLSLLQWLLIGYSIIQGIRWTWYSVVRTPDDNDEDEAQETKHGREICQAYKT